MPTQITVTQFLDAYEREVLEEVFPVTINNEKRVYARTVEGAAPTLRTRTVYCVVP